LENVPGLLTSNQGRDFGVVISALADAGFHHVEWRLLDSQHFGVPQRRRRVFIVASSDPVSRRPILVEPEIRGRNSEPIGKTRSAPPAAAQRGAGSSGLRVVNALTANGLGGGGPDDNMAQAGHLIVEQDTEWFVKGRRAQTKDDDETWTTGGVTPTLNAFDIGDVRATVVIRPPSGTRVRRLTPLECERLQGFPDDWTEGQSDRIRYYQMGNAVTVNVAGYLGALLPLGTTDIPFQGTPYDVRQGLTAV
jgi:DNA (cytosine-5)-methyltransferase 1